MQSELLPCPFCGSDPVIRPECPEVEGNAWTRIECPSCVVSYESTVFVIVHEDGGHREKAVAAWNRRARPWRPISEAPHNCTRVDVWNGARVPEAMWLNDSALPGWVTGPTFAEPHGAAYTYIDPQPTRFMLIPKPPQHS